MYNNNNLYNNKYLKYKQKYLLYKQKQRGGSLIKINITPLSGDSTLYY